MKVCTNCNEYKHEQEFYRRSDRGGTLSSWCRRCIKQRAAAYRKANPDKWHASRMKWHRRKYGIGPEEYEAMLAEQGGRCAICREPPNGHGALHIDHDHRTGKVRGLLCFRCNVGLGSFRDDPGRLEAAITYLRHGFVSEDRCS